MRRAFSLVVVGVAPVMAVVGASGAAYAADSADACVNIHTAQLGTGLAFDVQNTCDKRLACALTWTLTCENASGKATSKSKQEARFLVSAADTHQATGSAATCKDGWKIDDVSWSCAAASK
jgi:hypothetical protein